jgi:hypothetical protein
LVLGFDLGHYSVWVRDLWFAGGSWDWSDELWCDVTTCFDTSKLPNPKLKWRCRASAPEITSHVKESERKEIQSLMRTRARKYNFLMATRRYEMVRTSLFGTEVDHWMPPARESAPQTLLLRTFTSCDSPRSLDWGKGTLLYDMKRPFLAELILRWKGSLLSFSFETKVNCWINNILFGGWILLLAEWAKGKAVRLNGWKRVFRGGEVSNNKQGWVWDETLWWVVILFLRTTCTPFVLE